MKLDFSPRYEKHAKIGIADLSQFAEHRLYDLKFALIDKLTLTSRKPMERSTLDEAVRQLRAFDYCPCPETNLYCDLDFVEFLSPRLIRKQLDLFRDATSRKAVLSKYGIACRGVIQVGAHLGQELPMHKELGARPIVLIEANPNVFRRLEALVGADSDCVLFNCAATDVEGEAMLNITTFDQSSSLLPLGHHEFQYPHIRVAEQIKVPTTTLDSLICQNPALLVSAMCSKLTSRALSIWY